MGSTLAVPIGRPFGESHDQKRLIEHSRTIANSICRREIKTAIIPDWPKPDQIDWRTVSQRQSIGKNGRQNNAQSHLVVQTLRQCLCEESQSQCDHDGCDSRFANASVERFDWYLRQGELTTWDSRPENISDNNRFIRCHFRWPTISTIPFSTSCPASMWLCDCWDALPLGIN